MSDEQPDPNAPPPETSAAEEDAEATALATDDGKGNRMVPLKTYLMSQSRIRDLATKNKEYEGLNAKQQDIEARLAKTAPIVEAILGNPKLRAEVLRMQSGQPAPAQGGEEDTEAAEWAEESGLYQPDGVTLNVALARKQINRIVGISRREAADQNRPTANALLHSQADINIQAALNKRDPNGNLMATPESIQETVDLMGAQGRHLLAKPEVVLLIVRTAAGIDREKGRTPREPDEPLYIASAGGRSRNEPAIDSATRETLKRLGVDEKDYARTSKGIETAAQTRKGYVLGGD